jgi:glutathione synthase/RimK-type ligase-like ATP-grasp enzyme
VILVCGGIADTVTELVCARLEERGYPYRFLDLGRFPAGYRLSWHWHDGHPEGTIATADWRLDLADVTAVYVRYLGAEGRVPPEGLTTESAAAIFVECDAGLAALLEHLPGMVVNRLAGGMSNHSKPLQALLVRRCGLLTPPTLVTTDPATALDFFAEWDGAIVYKSVSGIRSIVRRVEERQLARLPLLRHGPAQFQALIPGDDVRVHTIGDQVIATRIRSEAIDYRYGRREGHAVEMEPTLLPADVESSCRRLASELDLLLAGIDLKVTPDGEYYCFEVNPSPGFLFYEQGTGQPISTALADLLHHGATRPHHAQEDAYVPIPSQAPLPHPRAAPGRSVPARSEAVATHG